MPEMLKVDDKLITLQELFPAIPHVQTVFLFGSYGTDYQTRLVILILPSSLTKKYLLPMKHTCCISFQLLWTLTGLIW